MIAGGTFYNWCLRLLLERVTAWVEKLTTEEGAILRPMEICFAQRGHDWEHFFNYVDLLRMQKEADTLFLKGPGLAAELLNRELWSVEPAASNAGLQLADTVASSFYQAANTAAPNHSVEPALALKPIIAHNGGVHANMGVTLFPLPFQAPIPAEATAIFKDYGYTF